MGEDNMNEIYLELLKKQFCEAYGLKKFDDSSKIHIEGLKTFLETRQELGRKYNDFLRYIGIDITTKENAELNKGNADSIIKDFDTLAVTQYPMDLPNERFYTKGDFIVKRFLTQNPYFKDDIKTLSYYYNEDGYDILFGVYGKIYDRDISKKMKQIITLSKKIKDKQYKTGILKDNNDYFEVVYTNLNETKQQLEEMKKAIENDIIIEGKTR